MKLYYSLNPQTYNDQFWWKKNDIEFWKKIIVDKKAKVLELASGTGRLAFPLIRENINYLGLEISKKYCNYANKQLIKSSNKSFFSQGDMRDFTLNKTFDIIFIGFNSLLHLLNESDLIKTLHCVRKHMHKESKLYIDIFVPHTLFLTRSNKQKIKICEFFDSIIKQEALIYEKLTYDNTNEIMHVKWIYESQGKIYNEFMFDMKMYYPDTMNRVLIDQQFKILNVWGNYDMCSFDEESKLQIYQCALDEEQ